MGAIVEGQRTLSALLHFRPTLILTVSRFLIIDSQTAKGRPCDTSSACASVHFHSAWCTARTSLSNRDLPNPALAIDGNDATRVANVHLFAVGFVV